MAGLLDALSPIDQHYYIKKGKPITKNEEGYVEVEKPVVFMVFQETMSVGGFVDNNGGDTIRYTSNEIDPLRARSEKLSVYANGKEIAHDLWGNIKANNAGIKWVSNLYALRIDVKEGLDANGKKQFDLVPICIHLKGSALSFNRETLRDKLKLFIAEGKCEEKDLLTWGMVDHRPRDCAKNIYEMTGRIAGKFKKIQEFDVPVFKKYANTVQYYDGLLEKAKEVAQELNEYMESRRKSINDEADEVEQKEAAAPLGANAGVDNNFFDKGGEGEKGNFDDVPPTDDLPF